MAIMKKIKNFVSSKVAKAKQATLTAFQKLKIMQAALAALLFAFSLQSHAALPEGVKTAIDGSKADGLEAGWLVVGVVAALFVIAIVKRMIK